MSVSSEWLGRRRARPTGVVIAGLLVSTGAYADSFLSDPLDTRSVLLTHARGLSDPGDPNCVLPALALTLVQAVDLALCRNPATRSAWAAARLQAAELGIAEATRFPTLSATGSENWVSGPRLATTDGGVSLVNGEQRTADAALNLSLTLFDFGGRRARISSARHLLDAAAATASSASARSKAGRWRARSWRCRSAGWRAPNPCREPRRCPDSAESGRRWPA